MGQITNHKKWPMYGKTQKNTFLQLKWKTSNIKDLSGKMCSIPLYGLTNDFQALTTNSKLKFGLLLFSM